MKRISVFVALFVALFVTPAFCGPIDWAAEKLGYVSNSLLTAEKELSNTMAVTIKIQKDLIQTQEELIRQNNEERNLLIVLTGILLTIMIVSKMPWGKILDFLRKTLRRKSKTEEILVKEEVSSPTKKK